MVSTLDFESSDPSSNLGGTLVFFFFYYFPLIYSYAVGTVYRARNKTARTGLHTSHTTKKTLCFFKLIPKMPK